MKKNEFTISWGSLWKILAMLALVAVLFLARDILIAILLAIIISSALDPFVDFLEKRRIPRLLGTLAIYIASVLVVALIIYIIVPIFLVELNGLIENSGDVLGTATESLGINTSIFETIRATINEFTGNLLGGRTTFVSILSQLLGGLLLMVIVIVISFYLTVGRDGVERFLMTILPEAQHESVLDIYERVRHKISFWFTGQLFLSIFIGVTVYIGLSILGVRYSFILAVTAALFELVPYVGPIFSGSVAILTALASSFTLGVYTLVFFVVIQQFESHVLIPNVNKFTTNLNPVIVIISLLIGAQVFGIIGIILAVPVAVSFEEILESWSRERIKLSKEAIPHQGV